MKKLYLIDDHPIVRSGIIRMLERTPGINVIGEAGSIREAREFLSHYQPDLILLDILILRGHISTAFLHHE